MVIIELKLVHSRALQQRSGPWRETWDVEYFLKAWEKIYAVSEVDKFAKAEGVWRAVMTDSRRHCEWMQAMRCLYRSRRCWWRTTS